MHRTLVMVATLLALGGVSIGVWCALQPPVGLFLVPDATDSQVGVGWWEWTLIYRTPVR